MNSKGIPMKLLGIMLVFALLAALMVMSLPVMADGGPDPDTAATVLVDSVTVVVDSAAVEATALLATEAPVALSTSDVLVSRSVGDADTMLVATQPLNIVLGTTWASVMFVLALLYIWSRRQLNHIDADSYPTGRGLRSPRDCISPA